MNNEVREYRLRNVSNVEAIKFDIAPSSVVTAATEMCGAALVRDDDPGGQIVYYLWVNNIFRQRINVGDWIVRRIDIGGGQDRFLVMNDAQFTKAFTPEEDEMEIDPPEHVAEEAKLNAGKAAVDVQKEFDEFEYTHHDTLNLGGDVLLSFCTWQNTRAIERQTIVLNRLARAVEGECRRASTDIV